MGPHTADCVVYPWLEHLVATRTDVPTVPNTPEPELIDESEAIEELTHISLHEGQPYSPSNLHINLAFRVRPLEQS